MEKWNWQQLLGFMLVIVGGTCGFISGLALLASFISAKYSFAIFIVLILIIGACLWIFGKKKGGKK
jgi:hypothetical protein